MLGQKARELSAATMRMLATNLITRGIIDVGIGVGAAAAIALGAYRVTHGMMKLQALLIVLMAGTEIFRPLRDFRTVLHDGMVGQAAAIGINALLQAEAPLPKGGARPSAPLAPTIVLDDVHFSYPGGRGEALSGLSLDVKAGERVGIVGPSGSGKSTVAALLLRLYDPQSGSVCIGSADLRSLDPDAARAQIAVVRQDTYLFHGTVEDNLRLGNPDATPAQIMAAACAANAHDFITALPQGYATMIGERGLRLSGGQRQRLAIARALLRDAPILILDEALSSVDAENEAIIQSALDRLMAGRTTLILAHRLSSVIDADRILVLDRGRVVESGTHRDLMQLGGAYRQLMGAQAEERGDITLPFAPPSATHAEATEDALPAEQGGVADDSLLRVERIDWGRTTRALLGFIAPWWRRLALVIVSGTARVAAYIGVAIVSALIVAALKTGRPYNDLLIWLAVIAPLAGILHWARVLAGAWHGLSPARRHAHRAVPQARCAGARLSAAPPLRRSGGAGDAGRRNHRIFLCPHGGAGDRRHHRAGGGAGDPRCVRLAGCAGCCCRSSCSRPWRRCCCGSGSIGSVPPRVRPWECSMRTSPIRSRGLPISRRSRRSAAGAASSRISCAIARICG